MIFCVTMLETFRINIKTATQFSHVRHKARVVIPSWNWMLCISLHQHSRASIPTHVCNSEYQSSPWCLVEVRLVTPSGCESWGWKCGILFPNDLWQKVNWPLVESKKTWSGCPITFYLMVTNESMLLFRRCWKCGAAAAFFKQISCKIVIYKCRD